MQPLMKALDIEYSDTRDLPEDDVVALYRVNHWSAAEKPELLCAALRGSHSVLSAWDGDRLVGLVNAISDGHLVVYFPHFLVLPEYRGRGIANQLAWRMLARYEGFHQQVMLADARAVNFYRQLGFKRAGKTEPMWIYEGEDH